MDILSYLQPGWNLRLGTQRLVIDAPNEVAAYDLLTNAAEELALSPVLYREIGWFLEHPNQAGGIVRAADNQQVVMSHANAQKNADFTAGAGVKKAVRWKRSDFWHPGDLAEFERDWKQKLEPNNPHSWVDVSWRSFDPELGISSPDGWIEFSNRYKLLVDEQGNTHHVSWNLGMRDIAQPIGTR